MRRARQLLAQHWLISVIVVLALAYRVWLCLVVPTALWFLGDSIAYVRDATTLVPSALRPAGYPIGLAILRPTHSLLAVVVAQHLCGLVIGVLTYWIALRAGLPRWAAALVAAVPLFDGLTVDVEHTLLSETLFTLLTVGAFALLYRAPRAGVLAFAAPLFLLGASGTVRSVGIPLGVALLLVLAFQRVGWRRFGVAVAAFALPLVVYASAYAVANGHFAVTESSGFFAYGRVAPFADCSRFSVPPSEGPLCETTPPAQRRNNIFYLFNPKSPLNRTVQDPRARNQLGGAFARRVIEHQPGDYAKAVLDSAYDLFKAPSPGPRYTVPTFQRLGNEPTSAARGYGEKANLGHVHGAEVGSFTAVQRRVALPGLGYLVLILIGVVAVVVTWRRSAARQERHFLVLLLVAGIVQLGISAATNSPDVRYFEPILPLTALAGAIGLHLLQSARKDPEVPMTATHPREGELVGGPVD